jgi:lipid II:glycine glycyltransferase (peptidoglycan interpeptide bridge formation enzyme)
MGKALPMHCLDEVRASEKLVNNAEYLEAENERQADEIADLFNQVRELTAELDTYIQEVNLKDKIAFLEKQLHESNKPSTKKKVKKTKKKIISKQNDV